MQRLSDASKMNDGVELRALITSIYQKLNSNMYPR